MSVCLSTDMFFRYVVNTPTQIQSADIFFKQNVYYFLSNFFLKCFLKKYKQKKSGFVDRTQLNKNKKSTI